MPPLVLAASPQCVSADQPPAQGWAWEPGCCSPASHDSQGFGLAWPSCSGHLENEPHKSAFQIYFLFFEKERMILLPPGKSILFFFFFLLVFW